MDSAGDTKYIDSKWNIFCQDYPILLEKYEELVNVSAELADFFKKEVALTKQREPKFSELDCENIKNKALFYFSNKYFGKDPRVVEFGLWCLRNDHKAPVETLVWARKNNVNNISEFSIVFNIIEKYGLEYDLSGWIQERRESESYFELFGSVFPRGYEKISIILYIIVLAIVFIFIIFMILSKVLGE